MLFCKHWQSTSVTYQWHQTECIMFQLRVHYVSATSTGHSMVLDGAYSGLTSPTSHDPTFTLPAVLRNTSLWAWICWPRWQLTTSTIGCSYRMISITPYRVTTWMARINMISDQLPRQQVTSQVRRSHSILICLEAHELTTENLQNFSSVIFKYTFVLWRTDACLNRGTPVHVCSSIHKHENYVMWKSNICPFWIVCAILRT